jgi:phytoene synthase
MNAAAETPTRDAGSENFPVASRLIARALRPKVLGFYRFVRAADDVADSAVLSPAEKLARLDALARALDDAATTEPAARPLHDSGAGTAEARRMLDAFRQDVTQRRYADWAALEEYCAASANPVGRMLLRLHGEAAPGAAAAADALSTALQILNHLQDLVPDRDTLDRIYLPESWLALAGGEDAFFNPAQATRRRAVLDAALDRVGERLDAAAALPRLVASRRLAMEARVTLAMARRLLARLRVGDPVTARVALTRADAFRAFVAAPWRGPSDAALVRGRVAAAGSSFSRGMGALRGDRRRALWAVYAFCRAVDDIADGVMPDAEKHRFLTGWQAKLTRPDCALSRELARARDRYGLPATECEAMIDGMRTDAAPAVRIADAAALDLYCRRVAGSVGAMAVRIFGAPEAVDIGLALGHTLQLVNILRDLDEDAARDRVYLPLDLLTEHGIADGPAARILAAPGIAAVAGRIALQAEAGFARAESALQATGTGALLPARIMMWGYRRLFDRLVARGFAAPRARPRLTAGEKARMAAFALRLAPVAAR